MYVVPAEAWFAVALIVAIGIGVLINTAASREMTVAELLNVG